MNKKLLLAIVAIVFAIATHAYLTNHYYPLKFGMAAPGESLCQMGAKMDCDVAATSSYSDIAGIPLSVFGIVFHFILLVLVVSAWAGLSEHRQRALRLSTMLAVLSVAASILLAIISATQLTAWCPFCLLAYLFSFIIAIALYASLEEPLSYFSKDIPAFITESRWMLLALFLIPAGSFLTHKIISKNFGGDQLGLIIQSSVNEWKANPEVDFSKYQPALSKGPESSEASMTLVEFADFRCGHCGQAAPSVHAFLKSHPDVRFLFFNFPLDGECNAEIGSGDGVSCRLAKAVTCAGKSQSTKGFQLHDFIFKNQTQFQTSRKLSEVDEKLKAASQDFSLDWEPLLDCMDSPETHEQVKKQAEAGAHAKIRGTPTFFVNGKLLSRGQFIPVLKGVYEASKKD